MRTLATRAAVVVFAVAAAVAGLAIWARRGPMAARMAGSSAGTGPALTVTIDGWGEEGCRCNGWGTLFVRLANMSGHEVRVLPSYRDGVNVDWRARDDDAGIMRRQFPLVGEFTEVSAKTAVTVRVLGRSGPSAPWVAQERWLARKPVQGSAELRDPQGTESVRLEPGQSTLAMIASRGDWEPIAEVKAEATYDDAGAVRTVESSPVHVHMAQGPAGPIPDLLPGLEWKPVEAGDNSEFGTRRVDRLEELLLEHRAPPAFIPEPDSFALPSLLGRWRLGYYESTWELFGEFGDRVSPTNEPYLRHLARYERAAIVRRLEAYLEDIHGFPAFRSYVGLVAAAFGSEHLRRVIESIPTGDTKMLVLLQIAQVPVSSEWLCAQLVEAATAERRGEIFDAAIEHECSAIVPLILKGAQPSALSTAATSLSTWFCTKVLNIGSCGGREPTDDTRRDGKQRFKRPFSPNTKGMAPITENGTDRALRAAELARLREKLPTMLASLHDPETLLSIADLDATQARPAIEALLAAQGGQAADFAAKQRVFAARYAFAKLGPNREQALAALLGEGWMEITRVPPGGLSSSDDSLTAPVPARPNRHDVRALYLDVHRKIVDDIARAPSIAAADALAEIVRTHPDMDISLAAIGALAHQGPALAVPRLMQLLLAVPPKRDRDFEVPNFECGFQCVPRMTHALRQLTGQPFGSEVDTWRAWWLASNTAYSALGPSGGPTGSSAYVRELAELLRSTNVNTRLWAATRLSRLGAKGEAKDIAELLKERHEPEQVAATLALGRLDAKQHAADIAKVLDHPYYGVVKPACYALVRLDAREHKKVIAAQLTDKWWAGTAAKALALLGAVEYADRIAKLATSETPNAAAYTPASRYGDSPARCCGVVAEPPTRGDALIALGILGAKQHAAMIGTHLEDKWRREAAIALLLMGDSTHKEKIVAILWPSGTAPTASRLNEDLRLDELIEDRRDELVARIVAALAKLKDGG
jgi:hypothetical protein